MFTDKMNFHFAIRALATLSFAIRYELSDNQHQDFFIFQGNQSHAHFYRKDNVLTLYLNHMDHFCSYQIDNITTNFWFSWPEFTVNDTLMTIIHQDNVDNINFINFTFISPMLEISDQELQPVINTLNAMSDINYNYLIIIMVIVAIFVKVDAKTILDLIEALKTKFAFENVYMSMKRLETIDPAIIPANGENQEHSSNSTKSIG